MRLLPTVRGARLVCHPPTPPPPGDSMDFLAGIGLRPVVGGLAIFVFSSARLREEGLLRQRYSFNASGITGACRYLQI